MKIIKGQTNTIFVTFSELTTVTTPYYLLEFTSVEQVPVYCIVSNNLSLYKEERFDKFEIIEKTNPNYLLGEITLEQGQYTYKAYEQASSTNLNPANSIGLVESGLCDVEPQSPEAKKVYEYTETKKVFNG